MSKVLAKTVVFVPPGESNNITLVKGQEVPEEYEHIIGEHAFVKEVKHSEEIGLVGSMNLEEFYNAMKVPELVRLCSQRGANPSSNRKEHLVKALLELGEPDADNR